VLAFRLARRFLAASPGQTALIAVGIAVGISLQVFVGSLITSLQDDLIASTVGGRPHVTLRPAAGESVPGGAVGVVAADGRVAAAVPVRTFTAIAGDVAGAVPLTVTSGTADGLDAVYRLADRLTAGAAGGPGLVVGTVFAADRGLAPGDPVELLVPDGRTLEVPVVGIVDLGAEAANEGLAFADPGTGRDATGLGEDEHTAIEVRVTDVFASDEVAADAAARTGLDAVDWQETSADLLSGLSAQSASSLLIQVFVLVAVALGIASTLTVSAVQKTRQVGILKAMGMTDGAAGRIFLAQAALLGVGGTAAGIGLGYALIAGFSLAPVAFAIRPEPAFVAVSAAVGVGVSLLSALLPSRRTSRLNPIEVIQGG